MNSPYWKAKPTVDPEQAGDDSDFIQLRMIREKKRLLKQQKFTERREDNYPLLPDRSQHKTVFLDCPTPKPPKIVFTAEGVEIVPAEDDADEDLKLGSLPGQAASHLQTKGNANEPLIISHQEKQISGTSGKRDELHILTEKNDVEMVKSYLDKISAQDKKLKMMKTEIAVEIKGQRPKLLSCLHLAAYHGHVDLVEVFLDNGMDVNHVNKNKDTALLLAAIQGHLNVVESLLGRNANPDIKNDEDSTALYWAVRNEDVKTVELLLTKGKADPNIRRKHGLEVPLTIASAYGFNDIVKLLLQRPDCDVNILIKGGKPIHHAAKEGNIDVILTLLEHEAKLQKDQLSKEKRIDDKDVLGDTPLLLAAQNKHVHLVHPLIKHGADVFLTNNEGHDVLNYAIKSEDNDLLKELLEACSKKGIDTAKWRPLCIAIGIGRYDKIDFLLKEYPENYLEKDEDDGNTCLHVAAMYDNYQVIKKFHKHKDTMNKTSNTPLHIACSNGSGAVVKTLLDLKAKAYEKNLAGETVLHAAAYCKQIQAETVKELVDYFIVMDAIDILNAQNNKGKNCLHVAGKHAEPDVIWEFRPVELKTLDDDGKTPLHEAVRPGQPECLNMMLKIFETMHRDARINAQSYARRETVLHLAAEEGFSTCVKCLIDFGADLSVKDVAGNTVLHRLTISTVFDPKHLKRHLDVFDTVLNGVVKWWCIKENKVYPEDNRPDYHAFRKRATLYLINDVYNEAGLSVLALSFKIGAADVISRLLMMPGVTMFDFTNSDEYQYVFDISRLTPRTNNALKGYCRGNKVSSMDERDAAEREKVSHEEVKLSGLEWLIKLKAKARAAQVLDIPPVKLIEDYYTAIVFKTFALLMLFHIVYMSIFTYVGVDLLGKLRDDESAVNAIGPEILLLYIFVPLEPAIIIIYILYSIVPSAIRVIRWELKLVWNRGIAHLLVVLNRRMVHLLCVAYAGLIIAWIVLFSVRYGFQDYILAAALCIGWLLSIYLTRGFKGINCFYRMLLSMIFKDAFRFLTVYLFVLLGFGFAFHVLFQVSSAVVQDYETPGDTLFLSFSMMIGMSELFDDIFAGNMNAVGRNVTYIKAFYLIYIVLSTIILLNLLIAMMNDSYSNILLEKEVTWRIDSVILGMDIENSFNASKIFSSVPIVQGHEASTKFGTTADSSGRHVLVRDRWYVKIKGSTVDEYSRRQDLVSENADGLTSRIQKLENKIEQMLEKTNVKRQRHV